MLSDQILNKLNDQISKEAYSAYLYYSMSAYFESVNLKGFANWMLIQAQEEITHTQRIFTYINDKGARVQLGPLEEPPHDWDSPLACLEDAYQHECMISGIINECVTLALGASVRPRARTNRTAQRPTRDVSARVIPQAGEAPPGVCLHGNTMPSIR